MRRALTLRGTLRLLGLGAMGYVALIAVVIAVRIGPTARALRRDSERMLDGYDAMRARTLAFHATIEDIHPLLVAVVRSGPPAAGDGVRPRIAVLRDRVDSLAGAASGGPPLSNIPSEMRIEFAGSSVQQSRLGVALTEALANLELGRAALAARRLQVADSIAGILDRHVAEVQRLGLVDLIRREHALADATTASLRAIGGWLALGIVLAPLFVVFLRRRFYDPLSALDRGLARVARGDLEGMIPVLRQDELGRLSGHFNETTAMLRQRAEETRRRAQAALRQSDEKFAIAFRSSPNPSIITRLEDGLLIDVNDAYVTATGFTRDQVIGRLARDVLWPNPEGRDALVAELRARGRVRNAELTMRTKAGPPLDVLVSVEAIELDGVPHALGAAVDITLQKRMVEALRESEERFRLLIQDLRVGVGVLDGEGHVLLGNRAIGEFLGVTETQLRTKGFWQRELRAIHDDGTPYRDDERPVLNAVRTGRPLRDVIVAYRRPGRSDTVWAICNVDPRRGPDGQVSTVIVTFHDITERRRAEEQLRLLAQAVKSTTEAISITDLEGRFTFVNRAFLENTGYTEDEVLGQPVPLIDSPRNPQGLQDEIRAATTRGGWTGELYNRRKDGTDFVIALTTAQVKDAEGRVIALMGVSSDITERKLADEQARQLQESLRRTQTMSALGAVVAGVAHEVRNPLFAISATVDALEARFGAQPAYARYTETLRQEVNRLSRLMSDLLDYGRPPRLDLTDSAIGPVVTRAIAACKPFAEQTGVRLAAELGADLPLLPLDPARMLQVFQNLIDNAIQHSPRGSQVVVRAAALMAPTATGIELSVADEGPGIRAEDMANIFEPFFTRRRGGTGLGLSIVQRIVEQHGGEVEAKNRETGGALITVRLCRAAGATA